MSRSLSPVLTPYLISHEAFSQNVGCLSVLQGRLQPGPPFLPANEYFASSGVASLLKTL